jgi:hypothetical protein
MYCVLTVEKNPVFLIMSTQVPPVVDPLRTKVQEAVSASPFNVFNIIAIVLILVICFYLYKRLTEKRVQRRFPLIDPTPLLNKTVSAATAPVTEDEVPDAPADDSAEEVKEE